MVAAYGIGAPSPRSSDHSNCGLVFGVDADAGVDVVVDVHVEGNALIVAGGEDRPRSDTGGDAGAPDG